jgi:hypothetical protein
VDDDQTDPTDAQGSLTLFVLVLSGKPKSHRKYRKGYWLTGDDMLFVVQVLLGILSLFSPLSYDMLTKALTDGREQDARRGRWIPVCVNTDHSSRRGVHWLVAVAHFVDKPEVIFWEPLTHTVLSADVQSALTKKGISVTLHRTCVQKRGDNFRCGYICSFWQLHFVLMLASGVDLSSWETPPSPPVEWEQIIWLLLEARDAQDGDRRQNAASLSEIGVSEMFRDALSSGVVVVSDFEELIRKYITDLVRILCAGWTVKREDDTGQRRGSFSRCQDDSLVKRHRVGIEQAPNKQRRGTPAIRHSNHTVSSNQIECEVPDEI